MFVEHTERSRPVSRVGSALVHRARVPSTERCGSARLNQSSSGERCRVRRRPSSAPTGPAESINAALQRQAASIEPLVMALRIQGTSVREICR